MFWVLLLAVSILLYVLLDGFDLGVGMLSPWHVAQKGVTPC